MLKRKGSRRLVYFCIVKRYLSTTGRGRGINENVKGVFVFCEWPSRDRVGLCYENRGFLGRYSTTVVVMKDERDEHAYSTASRIPDRPDLAGM